MVDPREKAAAPQAPAFSPNFKFKAAGKEHEIPEFLRGVVKDEQSQKFVSELFEKAYGLPALKERFMETRQQMQELSQTHQYVMGNIQEAQAAYRKGDLDSVFDIFKIAPEKVLQWAVEKVQYSQLPPEQRQLMDARKEAEKRAMLLEKQQSSAMQEQYQSQTEYLSQMLELVLERPDYSSVAEAYDGRKGQPGAFRELVIRMGESEFALTGKSISPLEAAKRAVELLGEMQPGGTQAPAMQAPAQAPATPAAKPKTVLPNLANAGAKPNAAPAKSKIRSLDDLKRKHQELLGRGE